MAKKRTRKERDAKAKAARRHPKNETDSVIAIPPNQESNDLLDAANMNKTSDQAAADPTINTQSADDVVIITPETDDPPPVVSYDLDGSTVIDTADDPIEEPPRSKTNEELIAEELAANADEKQTIEVSISEFSLNVVRDGLLNALSFVGSKLKAANDATVNGWIAFGDFVGRKIDALYIWAHEQNKKLDAQVKRWFPKPDVLTKTDFIDFIQALVEKEEEYVEHTMRLTKRIEMLEKAVQGNAPRTVSIDKVIDLIEAIRNNENTKATTLVKALTGATLGAAKSAVELAN